MENYNVESRKAVDTDEQRLLKLFVAANYLQNQITDNYKLLANPHLSDKAKSVIWDETDKLIKEHSEATEKINKTREKILHDQTNP